MFKRPFLCMLILSSLVLTGRPSVADIPANWFGVLSPAGPGIPAGGGIGFGYFSDFNGGYVGGSPLDLSGFVGVAMPFHRTLGVDWTGPTGFYEPVFGPPLQPRGSWTWSDIWMWSQYFTPPGNRTGMSFDPEAPSHYGLIGHLVLDYVPDSCQWTGPMEFTISLDYDNPLIISELPVPVLPSPPDPVLDADKVVRMHITIEEIPEPSSLAALALGLVPLAAAGLKRKRHWE